MKSFEYNGLNYYIPEKGSIDNKLAYSNKAVDMCHHIDYSNAVYIVENKTSSETYGYGLSEILGCHHFNCGECLYYADNKEVADRYFLLKNLESIIE